nr:MAG TPA: holin [Caudoviricetes sp.]
MTVQDVALWIGILCTLGTFIVNSYYKWKEDKRAEARDKRQSSGVVGPSGRCSLPSTAHADVSEGIG